jgi:hypothetical protein
VLSNMISFELFTVTIYGGYSCVLYFRRVYILQTPLLVKARRNGLKNIVFSKTTNPTERGDVTPPRYVGARK